MSRWILFNDSMVKNEEYPTVEESIKFLFEYNRKQELRFSEADERIEKIKSEIMPKMPIN